MFKVESTDLNCNMSDSPVDGELCTTWDVIVTISTDRPDVVISNTAWITWLETWVNQWYAIVSWSIWNIEW
jgi:hypothetical protein